MNKYLAMSTAVLLGLFLINFSAKAGVLSSLLQ